VFRQDEDNQQLDPEGVSQSGAKAARTRARSDSTAEEELYEKAQHRLTEGHSKMTKQQLKNARLAGDDCRAN